MKTEFSIEADSPVPLYEQIKRGIKLKIVSGILLPDDKLIPIREFARLLKVNFNTIVKVYYQLDKEGYLYSRPGQGYFVKRTFREENQRDMELFKSITDEYLKNATDLGFSIDYIIKSFNLLQKKLK
ncbi:MAG: GntR family transcriptional regulator [Candidatus Aminicenantes bacterium]|nr:GntR family transcriptional regulator [Candidatus Aminicenantes bacterium]